MLASHSAGWFTCTLLPNTSCSQHRRSHRCGIAARPAAAPPAMWPDIPASAAGTRVRWAAAAWLRAAAAGAAAGAAEATAGPGCRRRRPASCISNCASWCRAVAASGCARGRASRGWPGSAVHGRAWCRDAQCEGGVWLRPPPHMAAPFPACAWLDRQQPCKVALTALPSLCTSLLKPGFRQGGFL